MKFLFSSSFVIIISCTFGHYQAEEETYWPRVDTPLGTIEGSYNTSSNGQLYEEYLGIPYALPPTGERRFEVAKPSTPWTGILTAKQFGSSCTQIEAVSIPLSIYRVIGSEDCLNLNIYTPARLNRDCETQTSTDLLPVIFYIHGGGFQMGSGAQYGPKYLLNENIILVTINYRLGILGFLSTEDDTVPGNMGLKDQVMAMRWVNDNIVYFGGDPKRVTLVGQSAGGASVQYFYLTDVTAGLFQQGMSISGTALNCWVQTENSLQKAKKLAILLKCPSSNVPIMIACLKSRPADQIAMASREFIPWLYNLNTPFGPVVEKGRSEFTIIGQPPIESIMLGKIQKKPWITSLVSGDGLIKSARFIANATLLKQLNDDWYEIAPHLLEYNYTIPSESGKKKVSRLIRKHYFGKHAIDNGTVKEITDMVSDRLYFYDAEKAARLQALAITNLVRSYYFSYRGAHSSSETLSGTSINFGVSHLDDVAYVLDSVFDPTTTQEDRKMQKVLINLWVSYATNSIPDVGVKWPKLNPNLTPFQYLHIAGPNNIYMDESSNFGDKKFWLNIPFQENIFPKSQNLTGCKIQ